MRLFINYTLSFISVSILSLFFNNNGFYSYNLSAQVCEGLVSGAVTVDVKDCKKFDMSEDLRDDTGDTSFLQEMTGTERAKFLSTYNGFMLNVFVVKSSARKGGTLKQENALNGDNILTFLPIVKGSKLSCASFSNKRLASVIKEYCCAGNVECPCLTKTNYVLTQTKILGETPKLKKHHVTVVKNKEYQEAIKYLKQQDYKKASKLLIKLDSEGKLDIEGKYNLALVYRELDRPVKSIKILEAIVKKKNASELDGEYKQVGIDAEFLLARSYARVKDAGRSTLILGGYLQDPVSNKKLIQQSLTHPDFGWIKATKEYTAYKQKAYEVLQDRQYR